MTKSPTSQKVDLDRRFGQLLREAREDEGLTVRELARRSGVDATYVSRVERGLVGPPRWPKIAAMIRHLPSSRLARAVEKSGHKIARGAAQQAANQTLTLLLAVPARDFNDREWCTAIKDTLETCVGIVEKRMPPDKISREGTRH
jgi:transcriptional regulator with XRE-family HTH domain